jgi:hypothetical protein
VGLIRRLKVCLCSKVICRRGEEGRDGCGSLMKLEQIIWCLYVMKGCANFSGV